MSDLEQTSKRLIQVGYELRASDLHLHPRQKDYEVQYRIDGALISFQHVKRRVAERLIAHFKYRSGMDIGEQRRPQNGFLNVKMNNSRLQLRLSTLPTPYKESMVIRFHPQEDQLQLPFLSIFPKSITRLKQLIHANHGLLLITGPMGSGKTTTLYALLQHLSEHKKEKIVTIEDPIEKQNDHFIQMEVNPKAGITYMEGLKASLRHGADVIMIGEIRDEETARMAVRAAMTGHLVLSTLHTKNSGEAIYRLRDLGISHLDLKETLLAIVAQRLVELVCPFCHGSCSKWCRKYRKVRRKAIFEILEGSELNEALKSPDNDMPKQTLASLRRKAIALGFITDRRKGGDKD